MQRWILLLGLVLVLTGCGDAVASPEDATAVLDRYAERVMASDLVGARAQLANAGLDWQENMERVLELGLMGYTIADLATAGEGYTATVRWTVPAPQQAMCTYVRVGAEGDIALTQGATKKCPDIVTIPNVP